MGGHKARVAREQNDNQEKGEDELRDNDLIIQG